MSGFLGAIEGAVGDIAGGFGGGDFLSELLDAFEGTAAQGSGNSNGNGTMSEIGQIACALPSSGVCTPLSPTVVECAPSGDAGTGSPSWQGVFSCAYSQVCFFFVPVDGGPSVSNAVGCGVNNFPLTQAGLPCTTEGSLACSFDTTTVLECRGGAWTTSQTCGASSVCGGVACVSNASYCVGCQ